MATIIERTVTDDVADALTALDEVLRFAADTRAHLQAALRQAEPNLETLVARTFDTIPADERADMLRLALPGTLDCARHAAAITVASAGRMFSLVRDARLAVEPRDL